VRPRGSDVFRPLVFGVFPSVLPGACGLPPEPTRRLLRQVSAALGVETSAHATGIQSTHTPPLGRRASVQRRRNGPQHQPAAQSQQRLYSHVVHPASVLTLINANRMRPPIAPVGLDYVATAAREGGIETVVLDLGLTPAPDAALADHFACHEPRLVGLTFRNVDDCFWPSATSFVPELCELVTTLRGLTEAPIVLGGVGFSVFAERIWQLVKADYGVRGDGERAIVELYRALEDPGRLAQVPGLLWRDRDRVAINPPAFGRAEPLAVPTQRDAIDNAGYFRVGGQIGVETKRGCPRRCTYCADPLAKGSQVRWRSPTDIADEFSALAAQGVDVIHLCDGEFNVPRPHALEVCHELQRRGLGERVHWYTYATVTPFDDELADGMQRAGCVGIDFTGDAGCNAMLAAYGHPHRREDLTAAVRRCRDRHLRCMVDLLLGGPGETPDTVRETVAFLQQIAPDCVGASLGIRLYPGTRLASSLLRDPTILDRGGIRRKYDGAIDLLRPTFFIAPELGNRPAALVRELVGDDPRFFPPAEEATGGHAEGDHNYNDNPPLARAIEAGMRGAYWDILSQLRNAASNPRV